MYGFHLSNDDPSGKAFLPKHVRWSILVEHQSRIGSPKGKNDKEVIYKLPLLVYQSATFG